MNNIFFFNPFKTFFLGGKKGARESHFGFGSTKKKNPCFYFSFLLRCFTLHGGFFFSWGFFSGRDLLGGGLAFLEGILILALRFEKNLIRKVAKCRRECFFFRELAGFF